MPVFTIPATIESNSEIESAEHRQNYEAIRDFLNSQVLHLDGTTSITGPLVLAQDATANMGAVTKQQMDAAVASAAGVGSGASGDAATAQAAADAAQETADQAVADAAAAVDGYGASGWVNLTPQNGWSNASGRQRAQYRKRFDEVQVRGNLEGGSGSTGAAVVTLPSGFRPPANLSVPCSAAKLDGDTYGSARIYVKTNGVCELYGLQATDANLDLAFNFTFSTTA